MTNESKKPTEESEFDQNEYQHEDKYRTNEHHANRFELF